MLRNGFWPISQLPPLTRTQGKMRAQRVRSYWAEAWQNPCQPPVPQMAPVPGTQFRSSRAAQQSGWRPQDSSAGRAAGPSTGKEHSTVCSGVAWTAGARLGSLELARSVACPHCFPTDSSVSHKPDVQVAALPTLGLLPLGYFESWSSLAFCRIWQTSVLG